MQAFAIVAGIIAAVAAPTVAGIFHLRSIREQRDAKVLEAKAVEVDATAVDVFAKFEAAILREAAEKEAHARTRRALAACRRENRRLRASSSGA